MSMPAASVWMGAMTDTNSKPEIDAPEGPAPCPLMGLSEPVLSPLALDPGQP